MHIAERSPTIAPVPETPVTGAPIMSKTPSGVPSVFLSSTALSGVAGLMLGQVVLALALHHERSVEGLGFAMVFLLAGGAAVACFLGHRHQARHPRGVPAPMKLWVGALAVGVLASIYAAGRF